MDDFLQLKQDADLCVKCGLCVPVCPTWKISKNEANSPRGRIMLIEELAKTKQVPKLADHYLDACLDCGYCEAICPSNVPYTKLVSTARKHIHPTPSLLTKLLLFLSVSKQRNLLLNLFISIAKILNPLVNIFAPLFTSNGQIAINYLSAIKNPNIQSLNIDQSTITKKIVLFKTCFEDTLNANELRSIKTLLNLLGYQVEYLENQNCCGALHAHHGDQDTAKSCSKNNQEVFAAIDKFYISTTGCAQYINTNTKLANQQEELGSFIVDNFANNIKFNAKKNKLVLIHLACSQQRLASKGLWVEKLLKHVTNIKIDYLVDNETCCGAGGLSFLDHPTTSKKLVNIKIDSLKKYSEEDIVVISTNYACRMHLQAAINNANLNIDVLDPFSFLLSNLQLTQ